MTGEEATAWIHHFRSVPPSSMLIPRELAELRVVQINRSIDRKKHPHGVTVKEVAPHTLFHSERKERKAPKVNPLKVRQALAETVPKEPDGRIRVLILDKKQAESNG